MLWKFMSQVANDWYYATVPQVLHLSFQVPWLRFITSYICRCKWKQSPTYYQWLQSKSCQRCEEKIIILCLLFISQLPFLNWCGWAVMVTQDAGEQVCNKNHQIYRGNLIPFRDNICYFNVQLPLHLPEKHACRWILEEEIVDLPVYRCGICKNSRIDVHYNLVLVSFP